MKINSIHEEVGNTDIYLIDQIMKGRYGSHDKILDAGCGGGRNLHWFLRQEIMIHGVDQDENTIHHLRSRLSASVAERFVQAPVEKLPFERNYFDHVISSAVLHFAKDTLHFHMMMAELVRVLRPEGSLFIRMASDIGIEDKVHLQEDGVYGIPDGSKRFLLTRLLLAELMQRYKLSFAEPFKTTNVDDLRCMSTLVAIKAA
jgi:ubiquinone/menaquinone biosynthesis C-methylase UbiE